MDVWPDIERAIGAAGMPFAIESRKPLYNLYHVLNHLNLFGGGYGAQAERMINRLLATLE